MIRRLVALACAALWMTQPAQAAWSEATSPHFIVYSQEKPEALRAYVEKLERFDGAMRRLRRLDDPAVSPSNRLTVFVVDRLASVQKLASPSARGRSSIYGFYQPRAGGSFAVVPRMAGSGRPGNLQPETVLLHEYAHHFMFRNYSGAFPAWFVEGFAEFFAAAKFEPDGGVRLGLPALHRANGLFAATEFPLEQMLSASYGKLSPEQADVLYSRGWLLTHYLLLNSTREGQLTSYIGAINSGKSAAEAAKTFGDLKILQRELNAYMRKPRMNYLAMAPTQKVVAIEIRPLSRGASAIMATRMQSTRGVDATTAPAVARDMRRLASPFAGDPDVQRALAEAEFDAGDLDAAEAAADRALAVEPRHVGALLYKGRVRLARAVKSGAVDAASWKEARRWFVRANAVENDNPESLLLFYESYAAAKSEPTRNAIDGLYRAHELAPEDDGLRLIVVRQLLLDGKPEAAKQVLAPVAYAPHGGARAVWAASILATIEEAGAKAALARWGVESDSVGEGG